MGRFRAGRVEGDDLNPGQWFFHHNIVDMRQERGTHWGAQSHPHAFFIPHSPDGNAPENI